ncbi:shikimate dehydrogenase [Burkholderia sp. Tr-20355]|nr:shikimate dehydrogenase [Burkholderia sp. Tr-20355]
MSRPSFLIGLIGQGIGGSLSPAMHEEEGFRQGFGYVYRRIDLDVLGVTADALPELLDAAQRMGYNGLNITHPCKQRVIEHLDALSDDARALGAVNTVLFKDGKRIGHNTDWSGFAKSFRRGLPGAKLDRVVQLGAGGAGAAVAHAALQMGAAELTIFDVDGTRAAALAGELQQRFPAVRVVAGGAPSGD